MPDIELNKLMQKLITGAMIGGPDKAISILNTLEAAYTSLAASIACTLIQGDQEHEAKNFYKSCRNDFENNFMQLMKLAEKEGVPNPWDTNAQVREDILKEIENED